VTSLAVPCWTHLSPGREEMSDFRDSVWSEGTVSVLFLFIPTMSSFFWWFFLMFGLLVEEKFTCLYREVAEQVETTENWGEISSSCLAAVEDV